MIRENFENRMNELHNKMNEMAMLTIEAMENAFHALQAQNVEIALRIIEEDAEIDTLENEINELAVWMIAKEQPVARDLRRIISILKMASDIERIADFAVNTAKSSIKIGQNELFLHETSILAMKDQMIEMLTMSLEAFQHENLQLAKEIGELDDRVDQQNYENFARLKQLLKEQPHHADTLVELVLINRFVERAADHITNMAESTAYFIKGQLFDLN